MWTVDGTAQHAGSIPGTVARAKKRARGEPRAQALPFPATTHGLKSLLR